MDQSTLTAVAIAIICMLLLAGISFYEPDPPDCPRCGYKHVRPDTL